MMIMILAEMQLGEFRTRTCGGGKDGQRSGEGPRER